MPARAPALAATLLVWDLESREGHDSSGLSSFRSREPTVWSTHKWYEPASPFQPELPGDLAAAAGRLLRHLASEGLRAVQANDKEARDRR